MHRSLMDLDANGSVLVGSDVEVKTTAGPLNRTWRGEMPSFRPTRGLGGSHLQTVLGPYLGAPRLPATIQHKIPLSDGDSVTLHENRPIQTSDNSSLANGSDLADSPEVAIVSVHGLAGCNQSGYVRRLAKLANQRGWVSYRMDMRGAGDSGVGSTYLYHAGRSDDVVAAIEFVRLKNPNAKIFLCGFSLGGSIALHLLCEHSEAASRLLHGAVAVCPPLDLNGCSQNLRRGLNRIYDHTFARALWNVLQDRPKVQQHMGEKFPKRRPTTLYDFDNLVTAPLGGYESAAHYYNRFSTVNRVGEIEVPTLVIASQDDPLIPFDTTAGASWSASTQLFASEHGGHLGFIGKSGCEPYFQGNRWLEQAILHSINGQISTS